MALFKYFVKESNNYPRKVSSLSEKEVQQANEFVKHSLKEAPSEGSIKTIHQVTEHQ